MTEKQKQFCELYLISGNAKQAMAEAGYNTGNTHNNARLLNRSDVREYLAARRAELSDQKVARADEVLSFLTAVMRGEEGDFFAVNKDGEITLIRRPPSLKERISAAAMLGKRYALFTDKIRIEDASKVVFSEVDIPD